MAYKVAFLCLLLTVGCCSMASARSLANDPAKDPVSCYIYHECGWRPSGCGTTESPNSNTPVTLIVDACVNAIVVGKIEAVVAVLAVLKLLIKIDIALCAAVFVALKLSASVGVLVCANALIKLCAVVDGNLIVKLIIALKLDVLVELCLKLGVTACINLLAPLFLLIKLGNGIYIQLLADCCSKLYYLDIAWANVIAQVCLKVTADVCLPLLKILDPTCLIAVLTACSKLPGGQAFCCYVCPILGISLNLLGILSLCISIG